MSSPRVLTAEEADHGFHALAAARRRELSGWVGVAKWLTLVEGTNWWKFYGDSEIEVLASPEFQLPKTTVQQYRRVYRCFGLLDEAELEQTRPRLLHQACAAVEAGADAREVLADAQALSWSSFLQKWRPEKSPFSSLSEAEREEKGERN